MTVTLTPEMLADLRKRIALWRQTTVTVGHVTPDEVLAMLDRIEALERKAASQARTIQTMACEYEELERREK